MRIGLTSSLAVHTLILGWGLVTFSSPRQFDPVSIPSIPVELISFDVLSRVVQGTDRGSADKPSEVADQADQIRLDADNAGVGQRDERVDSDAPATADPSASATPQTPVNKPLRDTRAPGQEISLFDLKPIDDHTRNAVQAID